MDTIHLQVTGKPWSRDPSQLELIINYLVRHDTAACTLPNIGWVSADTTGAMDNDRLCWFHPPRHNQYMLLETAPFPRVEYPLAIGRTWTRTLLIGDGWGALSGTTMKWNYEVTGQVDDLWTIDATSTPLDDPSQEQTFVFNFHEKPGFTRLNYSFRNGTTITFILIE